jgi:hypothetical protein
MAIMNRDKDVSEQCDVIEAKTGALVTGASAMVCAVPSPGLLKSIAVAAFGVSGAPAWQFNILRFIPGSGSTAIAVGVSTLAVVAYGTSGIQQVAGSSMGGYPAALPALAPQSSTLAVVQAGDLIQVVTSGANTAVTDAVVAVVVKKTQDIVAQFGISG